MQFGTSIGSENIRQGYEFSRHLSYLLVLVDDCVIMNFTGGEERQSEGLLQPDLISNSRTKWRDHCCRLSYPGILCKGGLP